MTAAKRQPRVVEYEHVHHALDLTSAPGHQTTCCMGAAFTDGERCTCWEYVIEPEPGRWRSTSPLYVPNSTEPSWWTP